MTRQNSAEDVLGRAAHHDELTEAEVQRLLAENRIEHSRYKDILVHVIEDERALAKFGAALIRRPVREGRAMAERDDLISANDDPAGPARRA